MRNTNVRTMMLKMTAVGFLAGAFVLGTPEKAQAQNWRAGVQAGYGYNGYGYGYGDRDHDDEERAEAYARQEAYERHEAWEQHEAEERREAWAREHAYGGYGAYGYGYDGRGWRHHDRDDDDR